jgi:ribosome-binding factor A
MAEARRPERVSELVLRALSDLLTRELKDPRLRGVTLTAVRMSDDLRHAHVYFSSLSGSARASEVVAGFHSASGFIRREIGRSLRLRFTPDFEFEYDTSSEHAARIEELLRAPRAKS